MSPRTTGALAPAVMNFAGPDADLEHRGGDGRTEDEAVEEHRGLVELGLSERELGLRFFGGGLIGEQVGGGDGAAVLDAGPATGGVDGTLGRGGGRVDGGLLHGVLGTQIPIIEREDRVAGLHLIPDLDVDLGDRAGGRRAEERVLGDGLDQARGGDEAVLVTGGRLVGRRLDRRFGGRAAGELQGGDGAGKREGEEQDAFLEHKGNQR
jgi:hypothetical protein